MKEYLKMSDVFNGSVLHEQATAYTLKSKGFRCGEEVFVNDVWAGFNGHDEAAKYAAHAINSHDELVSKLDCAESTIYEVERVLSEMQQNGIFGLDDVVAEVEFCMKRLSQ